jgi:hypothetical protein
MTKSASVTRTCAPTTGQASFVADLQPEISKRVCIATLSSSQLCQHAARQQLKKYATDKSQHSTSPVSF